jgi:hypothetical protein
MSQFIEWAAPVILESNLNIRKTNGRVRGLEGWKMKVTTGWGMVATTVAAILALIGGIEGTITLIAFLQK